MGEGSQRRLEVEGRYNPIGLNLFQYSSTFGSVRVRQPDVGNSENTMVDSSTTINPILLIDGNQLRITSVISEGRYSTVYQGMYKMRPVAVKEIVPCNADEAVSPEHSLKFQREVSTLSRLKHENIVEFIGASTVPTMLVVTELMEGGTLQRYLWNMRPNVLDLKLAISFALDISHAMEYLHDKKIIHRDLKPANLLLTGDCMRVKVADFGLAREEMGDEKTCEAGTYRWMAPELFSVEALKKGEKKYYDHKVDIYSFSMVLWELLTNKTPFKGKGTLLVAYAAARNVRPSLEDIPNDIIPLLESCWSEDPETRPDFSEITRFLEKFYQHLTSMETPPPPIAPEPEESQGEQMGADPQYAQGQEIMNPERKIRKKSGGISRSFLSCFTRCLRC